MRGSGSPLGSASSAIAAYMLIVLLGCAHGAAETPRSARFKLVQMFSLRVPRLLKCITNPTYSVTLPAPMGR